VGEAVGESRRVGALAVEGQAGRGLLQRVPVGAIGVLAFGRAAHVAAHLLPECGEASTKVRRLPAAAVRRGLRQGYRRRGTAYQRGDRQPAN
jgi:hypothetical protein